MYNIFVAVFMHLQKIEANDSYALIEHSLPNRAYTVYLEIHKYTLIKQSF